MRIESIDRFLVVTAIWSKVGDWPSKVHAGFRVRRVSVRLPGPIRELIGAAVMFPFLDPIEFFRCVGVRPIVCREHVPGFIPAKAIGVSQAARINLNFRLLTLGVESPDARGQRHLPPLEVARISSWLVAIRA